VSENFINELMFKFSSNVKTELNLHNYLSFCLRNTHSQVDQSAVHIFMYETPANFVDQRRTFGSGIQIATTRLFLHTKSEYKFYFNNAAINA
jgi:hypothetical protein